MQKIHEKTRQMLFAGAASVAAGAAAPNAVGAARPDNGASTNAAAAATNALPMDQSRLYGLSGNGAILIRNMANDVVNPRLERMRSRCCQRLTLIHDHCANCTDDLCEECGYSCRECATFICRACVTVFGNNPDEATDPLCERCQMYLA